METVHSIWRDCVTRHVDASSQDACPLTVRCWKRNTARGHATTAGCQPYLAIQGQHRSGVTREEQLPHNARHTPISLRSPLWSIAQHAGMEVAKTAWLHHAFFDAAREHAGIVTQLTHMVADYSSWHMVNRDPGLIPESLAIQRRGAIKMPTLIRRCWFMQKRVATWSHVRRVQARETVYMSLMPRIPMAWEIDHRA